jgi:transcriptional regulator with XRE-family HTH domain
VEAVSVEATRSAIYELRRLSGLTWDQLARLFNVSRRSLHFWASGKPLNSDNQEHLQRLLSVLRKIDRGSAAENRIALLQPTPDGLLPIDLLAGARYDEVVAALGIAPARRKQITLIPLSAEAQAARKPVPPERLTGALHDNVHRDVDTDETIPMSREDREG